MGGRLPKGWKYRELGDLVRIESGGTPSRSNASYWGNATPWITAKDLKTFDLADSQDRLSDAGAKRAALVPENTVLVLVRGMGLFKDVPIGVTARPMAFNQDVKALRPKDAVSARFLGYALQAQRHYLMGNVDRAGHGTGRLPTNVLETLPVPTPPIDEQRRIVALLDACDRLVRGEQRKLLLLNALRRGGLARQVVRTGVKADKAALSAIAEIRLSGVDKKTVDGELPVRLCNYMDVFYNEKIDDSLDFRSATATLTEIARFTLQQGDVLLTKDSETADEIAECAVVDADLPGVLCGYHLALLRPHDDRVLGRYLAIALRDPRARHQFASCANGVTRFGLTLDVFDQVEIALPSLAEQHRIADMYATLSAQISDTAKLIERLGEQKRGLLQKLLTGEWRLTHDLPETEAADVGA